MGNVNSWIFQGVVKEKPRLPPFGEYNGMMVVSEKQPLNNLLDEGAMNLEGKKVIVLFEEITTTLEEAIEDAHKTLDWFGSLQKENSHEQ
jgi:hypothetical protein